MRRLFLSLALASCLILRASGADLTPDPAPKDKPAEAGKKDADKEKEGEPPAPVVTDHTLTLADLIQRCEEIAAASGGILGFGKISAEERALLGRIQSALGER